MTIGPLPRSRFFDLLSISSLPSNSFLCDVNVYDIADNQIAGAIGAPAESIAQKAIQSGSAEVCTDAGSLPSDASASIAIPVYRSGQIVSVVVLSSKKLCDGQDNVVGVFEVWEPIGIYEEVSLKAGFYGRMERFQNVSSFVRFEKGNGLPGQVWQQRSSVIHDDLPNHPGFLRAAGASAELLKTAIGIPIASDNFHSSVLLISSAVSPLAQAMEVWNVTDAGFSLVGGAFSDAGAPFALPEQTTLPADAGLPGLAASRGAAALTDDPERLAAGRTLGELPTKPTSGLAIPFFDGDKLASVTALYF